MWSMWKSFNWQSIQKYTSPGVVLDVRHTQLQSEKIDGNPNPSRKVKKKFSLAQFQKVGHDPSWKIKIEKISAQSNKYLNY